MIKHLYYKHGGTWCGQVWSDRTYEVPPGAMVECYKCHACKKVAESDSALGRMADRLRRENRECAWPELMDLSSFWAHKIDARLVTYTKFFEAVCWNIEDFLACETEEEVVAQFEIVRSMFELSQ